MFRSCRHGIDIRPAVSPRYHRTPRRSLCRRAARGRRDPDCQDQLAAAHDLHGDRQSAVRTHQQSVGSGEVLRRQQRRRSRRHRRRRLAAGARQRYRRLAAHSRGFLRDRLDQADRRTHTRPLWPWPADRAARHHGAGRTDGEVCGRPDDGVGRARPRPRSIRRPGAGVRQSGGRRCKPLALCDIDRRRRVPGGAGGPARCRRGGRVPHRGRSKAGRLAAA